MKFSIPRSDSRELKIFNFQGGRKRFFGGKLKQFSIKITSLAKYFAGAERNDEVHGLYSTFNMETFNHSKSNRQI